ncbi:MAG TPA: hypothetical protein VFH27_14820 [Longimicrobiaceae bacterium]|nr:hypothetical protein [Longimicrobiaceae bacterium]
MRRLASAMLVLALASAVHVDWHLARHAEHHGRLSLGWEQHWIFAALAFAAVGWAIARMWPAGPWRPGAWIAGIALIIAQGIEPVAESVLCLHQIGYPAEPGRWRAFLLCVAAGLPAYGLAIWLGHRTRGRSARSRERMA